MILTVRYESCIIESHRRSICCHETRNSATACEVMIMSTKNKYCVCVHTGKSRGTSAWGLSHDFVVVCVSLSFIVYTSACSCTRRKNEKMSHIVIELCVRMNDG